MKYLKQTLIILLFCLAGEFLAYVIPLPVPAAIYGIVLLFLALCLGILKLPQVAETAHYLISIMPLFFVAPTVKLLSYWGVIAPALIPICTVLITSTIIVFAVAGLVTQWIRNREEKKNG